MVIGIPVTPLSTTGSTPSRFPDSRRTTPSCTPGGGPKIREEKILVTIPVIIAKANANIVDMAHASVASLTITIESLLTSNSPMQSLTCDHSEDFSALHEKISSLQVFLKNFEKNYVSTEMTDVEVQIKEAANIVEHTIQLSVTEVLLGE
ncbi:hypothetical protein CQW23_07045 [Capsicum baccatum]|uniref:Uncharacterized protein n=1 Tax=Capsicum baccatum TaxID=33114 RepID=A0A2G2X547_CAPBA|nr:hypothetical protein CQW23_07045 [Capsicum baccatum]